MYDSERLPRRPDRRPGPRCCAATGRHCEDTSARHHHHLLDAAPAAGQIETHEAGNVLGVLLNDQLSTKVQRYSRHYRCPLRHPLCTQLSTQMKAMQSSGSQYPSPEELSSPTPMPFSEMARRCRGSGPSTNRPSASAPRQRVKAFIQARHPAVAEEPPRSGRGGANARWPTRALANWYSGSTAGVVQRAGRPPAGRAADHPPRAAPPAPPGSAPSSAIRKVAARWCDGVGSLRIPPGRQRQRSRRDTISRPCPGAIGPHRL